MANGPREAAYDESIAPLMEQVIALCRAHNIPVVASFELDTDDEGPLYVTTQILPEGTAQRLIDAGRVLYGPCDEDI